jgi:hypothetical protein
MRNSRRSWINGTLSSMEFYQKSVTVARSRLWQEIIVRLRDDLSFWTLFRRPKVALMRVVAGGLQQTEVVFR